MKHETKIRALRVWTRRIQARNQQAAENRAKYHQLRDEIAQFPDDLDPRYEDLRQQMIALLRDGIDQIPPPTSSDL